MQNDTDRNLGNIILDIYVYNLSDYDLFINGMVNKSFRFLSLSLDK